MKNQFTARLFFLPLSLVSLIAPQSSLGGVRATDPKRAALKLDDIKPTPSFDNATNEEPKTISSQTRREFAKAQSKFDAQLWAEAISTLDRCIKSDPGFVDARILLARAAMQHGDSKSASIQLREALAYRPRDVVVNQLLGELAWQRGGNADAIASLRLALMSADDQMDSPPCVLAHLTLALALEKAGYLAAAADQLDAYLAAVDQPTEQMKQYRELSDAISLYRGRAATMLGDLRSDLAQDDRSVLAYARAAKEKPEDPTIRQKWALALARTGQVDAAVKIVGKALASSGESESLYDLLKRICEAAGAPERYQVELKKLSQHSDDPQIRKKLVDDLMKNRDESGAADILESQVQSHPDDEKSRMDLIRLYSKRDPGPKLIEHMIALLSRSTTSYRDLDRILVKHKDSQSLVEAAADAAQKHSDSIAAAYIYAVLLAATHPDKAQDVFDSVLRNDKTFGPALVHLARACAATADWDQTLKITESALTSGLKEPELHMLRGTAFESLDDMPSAEKSFLEAFRLDNTSPKPLFALAEAADHRRDFDKAERLYRRIIEDVDPRHLPSRARLCRFYINNDRLREAKELLDDAKSLKLSGPAIDRCKAHFDLRSNPHAPSDAQIKSYCIALHTIIEKHPDDVDTLIDLAKGLDASGQKQDALDIAEKAMAVEPLNYVAYEVKAQIQFRLSDLTGATKTVATLLKQRPNDLTYQQMMLELYVDQDEYANAIAMIRKLLARDLPTQAHDALTVRLLEVLDFDEKFDQVVEQAKKWLQEATSDPARRQVYLRALVKADHKDEAVEAAAQWLKASPADESLRIQYLQQLLVAERVEEARRHVLSWLADNPDNSQLNGLLIQVLCAAREWDSAIDTAQTAMEVPEQRAQFEDLLGRVYLQARRFDPAIELLRDKAAGSNSMYYQRRLITVLAQAERFEEAEKTATQILQNQLKARDTGRKFEPVVIQEMRSLLALIYQRWDRPQKAIAQMEELYKLAPNDAGVNNDLGYTYADMGMHLKKAESMIRTALAERPRDAAYLDSLGWVLYKQDKAIEAVPLLHRAVKLHKYDPDPILLDHLADALYRTGEKDEARTVWEQALKVKKTDEDPLTPEEKSALARIKDKIARLDKGETVDVAPLGKMDEEESAPEAPKSSGNR